MLCTNVMQFRLTRGLFYLSQRERVGVRAPFPPWERRRLACKKLGWQGQGFYLPFRIQGAPASCPPIGERGQDAGNNCPVGTFYTSPAFQGWEINSFMPLNHSISTRGDYLLLPGNDQPRARE